MTNSELIKAVEGLEAKLRASSWQDKKPGMGTMDVIYVDDAIGELKAFITRQTSPEADRKAVGDEKPTFVLPSAYVETAKKHYGDYANIISTADTLIKPSPNLKVEQEHSPKTGTSSNTACVDEEALIDAICDEITLWKAGSRGTLNHHIKRAVRPYLRTSPPQQSALTEKERERVLDILQEAQANGWDYGTHPRNKAQIALTAIEQLCELRFKQ